MKDYTINNDDKKNFILNYVIYKNEIIIKFASGDIVNIQYSAEREKEILKKMKNQVMNVEEYDSKLEKKFIYNYIGSMISTCISMGCLVALPILLPVTIPFVAINISSMVDIQMKKNDIQKNKLFLLNEKKLDNINKELEMALIGLDNHTKDKIKYILSRKNKLDINDMDNISYYDLKQIVKNNELIEKYDLVEKQKVKKKNSIHHTNFHI